MNKEMYLFTINYGAHLNTDEKVCESEETCLQ